MIAGLPGTGIGGIFYLLIALWMPVKEVIKNIRGQADSEDTNLVKRHLFLTLCVIIAVIATGWLAGWLAIIILFGINGFTTGMSINQGINRSAQVENFLQIAPIILTSLTLLAVFLVVHGLRLVIRVQAIIERMLKLPVATSGLRQIPPIRLRSRLSDCLIGKKS